MKIWSKCLVKCWCLIKCCQLWGNVVIRLVFFCVKSISVISMTSLHTVRNDWWCSTSQNILVTRLVSNRNFAGVQVEEGLIIWPEDINSKNYSHFDCFRIPDSGKNRHSLLGFIKITLKTVVWTHFVPSIFFRFWFSLKWLQCWTLSVIIVEFVVINIPGLMVPWASKIASKW